MSFVGFGVDALKRGPATVRQQERVPLDRPFVPAERVREVLCWGDGELPPCPYYVGSPGDPDEDHPCRLEGWKTCPNCPTLADAWERGVYYHGRGPGRGCRWNDAGRVEWVREGLGGDRGSRQKS